MCLIAKMEKKADLPLDVIEYAMKRNSDGWGFMYAQDDCVVHRVGMGGQAEFLEALASVPDNVALAVHFRFATRGLKDATNAHPFKVLDRVRNGQDLFMMHNGPQITRGCKGDAKRSDTREFCEVILTPMLENRPRFIRTPTFARIMHELTTERVLFLEGCGKWHIVNADSWHKEGDVLYSNTYSLPKPEPLYTSPGGYYNSTGGGYYGGGSEGYGAQHSFGPGWTQKPNGAWTWNKEDVDKDKRAKLRLDGAGRIIPDGQEKPSLCPNRNNALCRVGCKIGDACIAAPKARKLGKVVSLAEETEKRILKAGGSMLSLPRPEHSGLNKSNGPNPWDDLHAQSTNEIFNLVVEDPDGCERYLRRQSVTFERGFALRDPDAATDKVIDTLFPASASWLM